MRVYDSVCERACVSLCEGEWRSSGGARLVAGEREVVHRLCQHLRRVSRARPVILQLEDQIGLLLVLALAEPALRLADARHRRRRQRTRSRAAAAAAPTSPTNSTSTGTSTPGTPGTPASTPRSAARTVGRLCVA
eukprot:2112736-Pleurochrysis_carterae.AAC.3